MFLSLGFFLLLASVVLLSFAVSEYFDTRKVHIKTLFALGFGPRLLKRILFTETGIIAITGSVIGALSGIFVNFLIIKALNSVWKGAVQTDTLRAWIDIVPILSGFAVSLLVMTIFMTIKTVRYLKKLNRQEGESHKIPSARINLLFLVPSLVLTITLYILSTIFRDKEITFCFSSGIMLLTSIVLFWRQLYLKGNAGINKFLRKKNAISSIYYSHFPSHAVTPILFIAAGIFAVFITGANRMNFSGKDLDRSSGTGGYLLWCETTIPVKNDLNTNAGRNAAGLDSKMFKDLVFVQGRVSSGNDASCLNLNHIISPPILGIDPSDFIKNGSFSFASKLGGSEVSNPWSYLTMNADTNTIYGIADQTVLEWGLKRKTGDTLLLKAEDGNTLKVIIAAGLESSVFQGYLLIGMKNFTRYFPSVPGSTIMLVEGDPALTENYRNTLAENFNNSGIEVQATTDRLAAFYEVTNTYLSVFGVFGAFGMIIGIAGLGFVLMRNYNQRKRDFALMLATGHTFRKIRQMILSEQLRILVAGVSAGVISAMLATLPSLKGRTDVPWVFLSAMVVIVLLTGIIVLYTSVKSISGESLTSSLKKE